MIIPARAMHDTEIAKRRLKWLAGPALALVAFVQLGAGMPLSADAQAPPQPGIPGLVVTMPPPPQGGPPQGQPPQPAIPGLVITNPQPPPPQSGGPQGQPQPKPAAAAAAAPKPKPKPRAKVETTARPGAGAGAKIAGQGIVALVNDEPITAYEVDTRARFMAISANVTERAKENIKRMATPEVIEAKKKQLIEETVQANQGKTREQIIAIIQERFKQFAAGIQKSALDSARQSMIPQFRKQGLDELIEERIKLQEAKKVSVTVSDDDVDRVLKQIPDRNKMTIPQFGEHLKKMGGDISVLRSRFRAQLAWREVIRRKFGHQISVSGRDIDQLVATSKDEGTDQIELQMHKIVLPFTGKLDQASMAARQAEASQLQGRFAGCKSMAGLARSVAGARFEDLGYKQAGTVAEPTRSLLLASKDGEMAPPSLTAAGVELYAVCGRRVQRVTETRRQQAQDELAMREFDVLSRRHMRDLRQDAHIEMR